MENGVKRQTFQDGQIDTSGFDALETVKGLVLVQDANDLLGGIVGGGDVLTLDSVDELGPMAFQKVRGRQHLGFRRRTALVVRAPRNSAVERYVWCVRQRCGQSLSG